MTLRVGDSIVTSAREPAGHTRLPRYLRAKPGRVEAVHALYPLADLRAAGILRLERLYTIAFTGDDLWGAEAEPNSVVHAELWESYLVAR